MHACINYCADYHVIICIKIERNERDKDLSLENSFFFQNSLTLSFTELHLIYIHRENIVCVHHIEYSA